MSGSWKFQAKYEKELAFPFPIPFSQHVATAFAQVGSSCRVWSGVQHLPIVRKRDLLRFPVAVPSSSLGLPGHQVALSKFPVSPFHPL